MVHIRLIWREGVKGRFPRLQIKSMAHRCAENTEAQRPQRKFKRTRGNHEFARIRHESARIRASQESKAQVQLFATFFS